MKARRLDRAASKAAGPGIRRYPSHDAGNVFKWNADQITVGTSRTIYRGSTLNNMSYTCGRRHTSNLRFEGEGRRGDSPTLSLAAPFVYHSTSSTRSCPTEPSPAS
jgi:hypothetical protein